MQALYAIAARITARIASAAPEPYRCSVNASEADRRLQYSCGTGHLSAPLFAIAGFLANAIEQLLAYLTFELLALGAQPAESRKFLGDEIVRRPFGASILGMPDVVALALPVNHVLKSCEP